ncbi:MAG: carbon-nitrogen hydrolase family protein [Candidatus Eremiobacteraeota bacterium]|nr:carbon-nitrogen hydrolase family protein [Candidatus Eremiobacteraeota bacterium]
MSRQITVALLQLQAHDRAAFPQRWPQICTRVRNAATQGAQLIVLPEGTVPAYVIGHEPVEGELLQAALDDMQSLARSTGIVIVYGSVRRTTNEQYNSAYVIDSDGRLAGHADKCFLWHFDRRWFAAGSVEMPIDTSIGKLGVMICADGRIPTISRALVDRGAEILVMPTAWVTSGRDPRNLENVQADLLAQVRAHENAVPFVAANKVGIERKCVAYCGKSQIIASDGTTLSMASQDREQTLIARVDLADAPTRRAALPAPPRAHNHRGDLRIAIAAHAVNAAEINAILGADEVVDADAGSDARLADIAAAASVTDDTVSDPGGLVPYRLAGYQLLVWRTSFDDKPWRRTLARARALELRLFIIVIAKDGTAFAVDPDGAVVCGTFGKLRVASFLFSPLRTAQTAVAPDTDIIEGLERASQIVTLAHG